MLLFAEASVEQLTVVLDVLEGFCSESGHQFSSSKSSLVVARNVPWALAQTLSMHGGFRLAENLGSYLGVPIQQGRDSKGTYKSVILKMQRKLAGWKSKVLSFAGRVTLAKSMLAVRPSYYM